MKKFESEEKNIFDDFIDAGKDKAPEHLMHKVMTQVEIEPLSSMDMYSKTIGLRFKIITASVISILLVSALSLPTSNLAIINKLSAFKLPKIQLPEFRFPDFELPFSIPTNYILAIIGLFGLLFLFDRFLNKLFFLTTSRTRD
ncbi:MAG: hypothetical protein QNK33_02145 [Bacteroidales bacterium]|nr:hypothetical protein [Bacteroidales bacterium]